MIAFARGRFAPHGWQLLVLEGVAAAAAYALAMAVRFVDDPQGAQNYALRTLPWLFAAAAIQIAGGELARRLRRPGSLLAERPVLPYVIAGLATLLFVLAVNKLLPVGLTLPTSVAVTAPLLASAAVAALQIAGSRSDVSIDDLLPRRSIELDVEACAAAIRGKRVLITGAAGSIGSELARQILALQPAELVLLDVNESGLYELDAALAALRGSTDVRLVMADVADARRIGSVLQELPPSLILHAAAYKHVPLVEANPDQGFISNVMGTLTICEAAIAVGTEHVLVISTDKAVNPTSVMGLTKRVAELIVVALSQQGSAAVLSAVRFVNVLGSRGSVVPMLLRQIEAGGPVTITDAEAHRFFMTVAEAASLVLWCVSFGTAGAIFVLDMGDELRIVDLAERLVRLKGLRPGRDVAFEYVGLRPGERLHEQLAGHDETLTPTQHPNVRQVEPAYTVDGQRVLAGVRALDSKRRSGEMPSDGYVQALRSLIESSVRPAQPSLA
jgi:FlaA1/EpsC-like NDP-sugar epimerase